MFFAELILALFVTTFFLPSDVEISDILDVSSTSSEEIELLVAPDIYNVQELAPEDKPLDQMTYLAQRIPYPPVNEFRKKIEELTQRPLRHRGEAHITVITPPEYKGTLQEFISMEELTHLAHAFALQESSFRVLCLGRAILPETRGAIEEETDKTYYLVVESERLMRFREKVQIIYEERGGSPGSFLADHYFPHITIGFTERDLHENDGIRKDSNSCWAKTYVRPH